MCAALSPLQSGLCIEENSAFHHGQSRASMSCLCRPSKACIFLFLPIPASLSRLSKVETKPFFSHLGLAAAPGFVHTAPHGSNEAGLGLRWCRSPTRCPKTHTGSHRGFFSFALSLLHFSPTGKSWPVPETVLSRFAGFVHKRPTLAQRGVFVLWLYLSPTRLSKPHTGPQVVIYRLVNG